MCIPTYLFVQRGLPVHLQPRVSAVIHISNNMGQKRYERENEATVLEFLIPTLLCSSPLPSSFPSSLPSSLPYSRTLPSILPSRLLSLLSSTSSSSVAPPRTLPHASSFSPVSGPCPSPCPPIVASFSSPLFRLRFSPVPWRWSAAHVVS